MSQRAIQRALEPEVEAKSSLPFPWQLLWTIILGLGFLVMIVMSSNQEERIDQLMAVIADNQPSEDMEVLIRTLLAEEPAEPQIVEVPIETIRLVPSVAIGIITGDVNIREGQGTQFDTLGTVTEGEEVILLQCDNWCQIRTEDDVTAWVSDNYVRFSRTEQVQ